MARKQTFICGKCGHHDDASQFNVERTVNAIVIYCPICGTVITHNGRLQSKSRRIWERVTLPQPNFVRA
jgi:transcription elongation factor Elf1